MEMNFSSHHPLTFFNISNEFLWRWFCILFFVCYNLPKNMRCPMRAAQYFAQFLSLSLLLLLVGGGCSNQGGTNGQPDPSFGNQGAVVTPLNAGDDMGLALALQSDGKIVVAGCSVTEG